MFKLLVMIPLTVQINVAMRKTCQKIGSERDNIKHKNAAGKNEVRIG